MPRPKKIDDDLQVTLSQRLSLDERFVSHFMPTTILDSVEAEEFSQIVQQALEQLEEDELAVMRLRLQARNSPGQVARKLGLPPQTVRQIEAQALQKLSGPITEYLEG